MGTAGLVGQIMTWQTMISSETGAVVLLKILLIQIVLPAVVTLGISEWMRSVKNACINLIARKKRDERLKRLLPLSEEKLTEEEPSRLEERWQAAVDCIDHDLTDQTASVIRLCYREGMSYKDTAEELGISVSAVNKHIVKGLRTLREKLKGK